VHKIYYKGASNSFLGKLLLTISAFILLQNCQSHQTSDEITSIVIEEHGGQKYKYSDIKFDFRGKQFNVYRNGSEFRYQRTFTDTTGENVHELITNKGKQKFIDGLEIELDEKAENRIDGAINSVVYFTLLPFPLADKAAVKRLIGEDSIEGKDYHLLEVTFKEQGGGKDFEDRYVYWINKRTNQIDYFAYYFQVNGGGSRFRKMVNPRRIGGILFFDQINYTAEIIDTNIEEYSSLLKAGSLKKVSNVIIENIEVKNLK
jgi:hypothetical protein